VARPLLPWRSLFRCAVEPLERAFAKDGRVVEPVQRWTQCDLLRYSKSNEGWGYNDLEESMHPYFYSCPLGYLEMVPLEVFGGNEEWRTLVRSHHQRLREKRTKKKRSFEEPTRAGN
jgi:hypothetical protein